MTETKICTKCKKEKAISEFPIYHGKTHSHCFQCKRDYGAKHRKTVAGIYQTIKGRSKFYGNKPFNISFEEFAEWYNKQQRVCHYCDLPEEFLHNSGDVMNIRISRLSIDCMDNKRGYTKGNLVLSCHRCNYTKNDAFTHEQMLYIGKNFLKPRWEKDIQSTNSGVRCLVEQGGKNRTDVVKASQLGFEVPEK